MDTGAADIDGLERAVFAKKPVLARVLAAHGATRLSEYARTLPRRTRPIDADRQDELIAEVAVQAGSILGARKAESVARQLKRYYYASTTDHHGPLTHPFFAHANLMAASPYVDKADADHENLIVLACGNTSLGNSSWPRGLLFNGDGSGYERVNFFPSTDRSVPVFGLRAYTQDDMRRVYSSLLAARDVGIRGALHSLLEAVYGNEEVLNEKSYARQITKSNADLWHRFFDKSAVTLPDLVYLEQEAVVNSLLLKHHLDADTELHRFLFDGAVREKARLRFDGIPGAFSTKPEKGTFLFWLLMPERGMRIALWPDGDRLVSKDGRHAVALDPDAVRQHLQEGRLIPSMLLSLMTLSSYYGLKCLGGFSQVDYLTRMEQAYADVMSLPQPIDESFVQGYCGEILIAAAASAGGLVPATGIDLALHHAPDSWDRFADSLDTLTLRESFGMMLPELYTMLYQPEARAPGLAALTQRSLMDAHAGTLAPCIRIPA